MEKVTRLLICNLCSHSRSSSSTLSSWLKVSRSDTIRKKRDLLLISHHRRSLVCLSNSTNINHNLTEVDTNKYNNEQNERKIGNFKANRDPSDYKVVFLGSDSFSLPSLIAMTKFLKEGNLSVVVSNENNIIGKFARKQNQPLYLWKDFKRKDWSSRGEAVEENGLNESNNFDFGVVASFGYLIPKRIINRFPLGILNVHASLLPRWRGASPINHAIINGDSETGISIMQIAPHRFDIGPVLHTSSIPLDPHVKASDLLQMLAEIGATSLIKIIDDLPSHLENPLEQDESLATAAPKLSPEMAEIDWNSKTSSEIYRLYRGLHGVFKLKTEFYGKGVDLDEIEEASPSMIEHSSVNSEGNPGEIMFDKERNLILVRCKDSTWISVGKLKLDTKKWITPKDFQNGFLSKLKITSSKSSSGEVVKNNLPRFNFSNPKDSNLSSSNEKCQISNKIDKNI